MTISQQIQTEVAKARVEFAISTNERVSDLGKIAAISAEARAELRRRIP